jgi:hypothetical protein
MEIHLAFLVVSKLAFFDFWNDAGRPLLLRNLLLPAEFVLELPWATIPFSACGIKLWQSLVN